MTPVTIIDNDYITLWFYPDSKIIRHKFKKFISGDHLRGAMMQGAELLRERGAKKWLSDDRENIVLSKEDRDWGDEKWWPFMLKAGWKYWAMVLPNRVVGQMSMKRVIADYADKGLTVQIFDDPEQGLEWLAKQ